MNKKNNHHFFRLLPLAVVGLTLLTIVPTSCRMAPKDDPGDTVATSVFAPIDTALLNKKKAAKMAAIKDSADIFYIGSASNKKQLQLISYPSRRDTIVLGRARHMKKSGNADFGHAVRVQFWVSDKGDSLVKSVISLGVR